MNRIKTDKNPKNLVNPVHFCALIYLVSGNENLKLKIQNLSTGAY